MPSARTRLNEMRARRVHPADTKDAAAEFLYWSDEARELRSNIARCSNRRHEDWYDDAVNELERVNRYRKNYITTRLLERATVSHQNRVSHHVRAA